MALPKSYLIGGMLIAIIVVGIAGYLILQPPGELVAYAEFSTTTITPNADGRDDVTVFSYKLSRNATISLTFQDEAGREFVFRDQKQRIANEYHVNFSGVVDGFTLPDDGPIDGTIERRLLPNGQYTWTFQAHAEDGEAQTIIGELIIAEGNSALPIISTFELSSSIFTPNQDGVRDRVQVNVYLTKPAQLDVYLEDEANNKIYLGERLLGRDPGDEGNHEFDYDGGVDDGFEPPPDGDYTLYAVAQDFEGQRIARTTTLTIQDGGLPQAEITPQSIGATVCFSTQPWDDRYYSSREIAGDLVEMPEGSCSELTTLSMEQGDLLVFQLAVFNYGRTPIRTDGPFAGTVYQFDQLASTLGYLESDGTFRIGIHCSTAIHDHPWRWGLGDPSQLTEVFDPQLNDTFYYLMPGERAVVWGAIRMTEIFEEQNPQDCSASLIHEGVNIDPFQRGVGVRSIEILSRSSDEQTSDTGLDSDESLIG